MRRRKWRGTTLFAAVLIVMGLTVGLRFYGADRTSTSGSAAAPQSSAQPTTAAPTAAAPAGGASSAATTPSAAPAPAAPVPKQVSGAVENTPYGPVQVQLTLDGQRITNVVELQSPTDEQRSVRINSSASPVLRQEVLTAQSAHVDTVSGATYTSEGYAQSVQSAIDHQ